MERYMVFARTDYDEPLEHRGDVEAEDGKAASEAALREFGRDWLEMSLVPESKVYWAEREDDSEDADDEVEAEVRS